MKQIYFDITENNRIAKDVYKIILKGDTSDITNCGQFVNIKIDEMYLRRPISVCDYDEKTLTLIYKVVGAGTEKLSRLKNGKLDILTGLGNGYDINFDFSSPLLIGGGVGVPPLYNLAKKLISEGKKVKAILGFNKVDEVFLADEFKNLGVDVYVSTVDGSCGTKGFVTDVLTEMEYDYFFTCGPEPMLKSVYNATHTSGQFSFEERMGCGFGACMGCSCKTVTGYKRICKEGPVLKKEEILW